MPSSEKILAAAAKADALPAPPAPPVTIEITIEVRLYHKPVILHEEIGAGKLGDTPTQLCTNMMCGPLRDDAAFIVVVGDDYALLDNESLVRAVHAAARPAVDAEPRPHNPEG